jgi:hypothetical protein
MSTLARKSDAVLTITIVGGNGSPLVISTLADLEVVAYQKPRTIFQRWKLSDGDITTVNDAGGIVDVNFDRSATKATQIRDLFLEVIASFTDADFADNIRREVATSIELAEIVDSPTA